MKHFDPLRPNRITDIQERYEFTHGKNSICIYDIQTMEFVKEIPVGQRPDCHSTSLSNNYLYMACEDGLYILSQQTLDMVKVLDTGHVYGTNVMPDGNTMLLHDAFGGIFILKRIDVLKNGERGYTLGGKGHFYEDGRYYLVNAWQKPSMYVIDLTDDYSFEPFISDDPVLELGDDLVISRDKTRAYSACYRNESSHVALTDIASRKIIKTIATGGGTCGLTMTNDERYVIASNDRDDSVTVIDTATDSVKTTLCARNCFSKLGLQGYMQGISIGRNDEVYVYCCNDSGALVKFEGITTSAPCVTVSWSGGKIRENIF